MTKQAVGGRPPQYVPTPLLPPWAPKRLAPPSRRQRSSSFPRPTRSHAHRCSRLTHQHGGEQSGLVILTFDLLTLKVHVVRVTCDVGYLCANFGLPVPLCSRVMPDVRDRQTSDVRQTEIRQKHRLMPPPIRCGGIISWEEKSLQSRLKPVTSH